MGKPRTLLGFGIFCVLFIGPSMHAQVVSNDPARIRQTFMYLTWDLKGDSTDATVSEWVLPVSGMLPLAENTELRYYTSLAGAKTSSKKFDRDLSGLTDTRLQVTRSLADDRFLVSLGVSVPTGQKKLNRDQFEVLRVLSAEQFNFPLKTFGEGLGVYSEVLGVTETGSWILGAGAGALYSGSYKPADNDVSYRPGIRLYLTGSAQLATDETDRTNFRFDGVAMLAGTDEANDKKVFRDGPQVDLSASGTRRFDPWSTGVDLRTILRGKDKRLSDKGILAIEQHASSGNEFRGTVRLGRAISDNVAGQVDVSTKFVTANSYPKKDPAYEGTASLYGVGGQISGRLSDHASAGLGLRKWFGHTNAGGQTEALDLNGWEIAQHVTITF